jgi:uncharacterized protein (TIGR02001 family)
MFCLDKNSFNKKILLAAVAVCASGGAVAQDSSTLAANVGATSNYVWRGVTQSNDGPAVQGGVDFTTGGAYVGVWASSLAGGDYETDVYAGYKFAAGPVNLDVGVIDYLYPLESEGYDDSFYEGYIGAGIGAFSAKISYSPDVILAEGQEDEAGLYAEVAYSIEVGNKSTLNLHVGNYSGDGIETLFGSTYSDASVAITKEEFTFGVSKTFGLEKDEYAAAGGTATDPDGARLFVNYKKSFGL